MTRVLVTGGTGFIGRRLVEILTRRGDQVRCLVRGSSRTAPLQALGAELVRVNLCDVDQLRSAIEGCDIVYHLAGKTSALTRRELYQTNVNGSSTMAQACAVQANPPTLVLVSSLAAAGTAISGRQRSEADGAHPVSEYGRSKRAGELAAARWSRHVPISVVRPAIVFGPRNREMLPMFQSITRYLVHPVPGFSTRRVALIHNDDLVDVLLRVGERGERLSNQTTSDAGVMVGSRGVYFAAAPEFPTYIQLGRMIAKAVGGQRVLVLSIAEPFAWLAAMGNQTYDRLRQQSSTFNIDKMREAFAGDWIGCTRSMQQHLGFRPQRTLQERLNETAEWYRREGWI